MGTNETAAGMYERPTVTVVGTLREKTESPQQNKIFAQNSDFHYPDGYSFNFS
jgi:hypothetical protein